jgi:acetylornithine deacetylase
LVSVIAALRAFDSAGIRPSGDVVVAFVGDEESGQPGNGLSDGIKAVVRRIEAGEIPRAEFAIYTEPTTLDIYAAQMGFLIAELTVIGKSSYFGKPWLGVDALRGAHGLLADLFSHSEQIWARREHPLIGRAFVLVYAIGGGGYVAVPERCTLTLILKVLPGDTLDAAGSELEAVVRAFETRAGMRVRVEYTASRDHRLGGTPVEVAPEHPAVELLGRALARTTGRQVSVTGAPYWSEVSFLHALGIPAVYCGPGDITNCHTSFERVPVAEVVDAARAFAGFVVDFCGLGEGTGKGRGNGRRG